MNIPEPYLIQWAISNVIALMLLFLCWKYPKSGRIGFGVIFLSAGVVNTITSVTGPHVYLEYSQFATLEIYRSFIEGFFSRHIQLFVASIAVGQFLISLGLFYGKMLLKPALIGGMIFSVCIIPLGFGAGMPVPVLMLLSLVVLYRKGNSNQSETVIT
ncbi:MAG: hypothetical protein RIM99_08420 [Cyclobacteriaceae bacterium]